MKRRSHRKKESENYTRRIMRREMKKSETQKKSKGTMVSMINL